jgi:Leucine-rich repeat (LRR) protein
LYNNPLAHLPDSMGHLVNLRTLYLCNNQLSSLPDSIGHLVNN